MLTLEELCEKTEQRSKEIYPQCQSWDAADWMTALCGEVGELANFLKKQKRGKEIEPLDLAYELADIQGYLCLLASHLNINLEEAVRSKFNKVSQKMNSPIKL